MAWVHSIKLLIIINRHLLLRATFIHRKRTVSVNQMPLVIIVSGRLARYNGVLADLVVLTLRGPFVDLVGAVRMTGVLLVQCPAGKFAPVKTWRLLCCVVPKADGDHLLAVRGAQIETVGCGLLAQLLLLELHDLDDGLLHRIQHFRDWILFLPRIFGALVSEVGHVQGRRVLRIRAAQNIGVGVETEQVGHVAADAGEIGDGTIMHEDMAAEDEGVAVDFRHDATTGCADWANTQWVSVLWQMLRKLKSLIGGACDLYRAGR